MSEDGGVEGGTENSGTIMDGNSGGVSPPQTWPNDWRVSMLGKPLEEIQGDDALSKQYKQLERYNSPQDVWGKTWNLQQEFSKRTPRIEYDPEMSPEKLSEWRKQEGIPDSPDGYKLEFDSGLVVGENDKPFVDEFLRHAHESNMPEGHVKNAIQWYLQREANDDKNYAKEANDKRVDTLSQLKAEYGPEYEGKINSINELFIDHKEFRDILSTAIGPDGFPLGNNEQFLRWAIDTANKVNPVATFIAPGGDSGVKGLTARIGELKSKMGSKEWYENPALGKEYEQLLSQEAKLQR